MQEKIEQRKTSTYCVVHHKYKRLFWYWLCVSFSQEGGCSNSFRLLITASLALMKNVLMPLAKNLPFELSAGMSTADSAVEIYGSGTTALIISNEEMKDMMKIVKLLEESGLLV